MKFETCPEVFFRFAREMEAPHWHPYLVRWERIGRLRREQQWLVRSVVEFHRGFNATA